MKKVPRPRSSIQLQNKKYPTYIARNVHQIYTSIKQKIPNQINWIREIKPQHIKSEGKCQAEIENWRQRQKCAVSYKCLLLKYEQLDKEHKIYEIFNNNGKIDYSDFLWLVIKLNTWSKIIFIYITWYINMLTIYM